VSRRGYATMAEAYNELDDQEEAAKWRRKATGQNEKLKSGASQHRCTQHAHEFNFTPMSS